MSEKREDARSDLQAGAQERSILDVDPDALDEPGLQDLRAHQIELEIQNQELQETQIQLQDSLRKYRELYDRAPVGYFTLGTDGVIRGANLTIADMLGVDRGDLIGRSLADHVFPEDQDQFFREVRRHLSSMGSYQTELRIQHGDGQVLWVSLESSVELEDRSGEMVSWCSISDLSDRKTAQIALEKSRDQLRDLTARLQEVREEERTRLARELHDGVGQSLAALGMDLAWLKRELGPTSPANEGILDGMRSLVQELIENITVYMVALRPPELDVLGIAEAMEHILMNLGRKSDLEISSELSFEAHDLENELRTHVLRIFEGAVSNVLRHASAKRLGVHLWREGDDLLLVVEDDGCGITDTEIWDPDSLGLIGMRERARTIGGEVLLEARPSGGTRVRAMFPLPLHEA